VAPFDGIPEAVTGQTPPSTSTAGSTTNTISLSWTADPNATGYKVYRGSSPGGENLYYTNNGQSNTTFIDTGVAGTTGIPLIVATAQGTTFSPNAQRLGGLYLGTPTATGLSIDANGDLSTNGAVNLNGVTTIQTLNAIGLGVAGASILQGNVNITGNNSLTVGGASTFGGAATFSNNLTLNGTNPQINVTGSNTLTLNGANSTGDIQFFSNVNTLSSTGNLTLAGNITDNATSANTFAGVINDTNTGTSALSGVLSVGTGIVNTGITVPQFIIGSAAGSSQTLLSFNTGGVSNTERIRADSSGDLVLDGSGGGGMYLNYDSGTGGTNFGNGASGVVAHIDGSGNAGFNGDTTISGAGNALYLNNGGQHYIDFGTGGVSSPLVGTGYKLILYDGGSLASEYGMGIASSTFWNNIPNTAVYQWNGSGNQLATLDGTTGNFQTIGSVTAPTLVATSATSAALLLTGANSGITFAAHNQQPLAAPTENSSSCQMPVVE